jgi:Arc/MetJ-type ribon-helix-helix transcriptional regulator
MSDTVTFRLDPETARILKELTQGGKVSKSHAIKSAIRARARRAAQRRRGSARDIYFSQNVAVGEPRHDNARNHSKLLRETLLAKRLLGTL